MLLSVIAFLKLAIPVLHAHKDIIGNNQLVLLLWVHKTLNYQANVQLASVVVWHVHPVPNVQPAIPTTMELKIAQAHTLSHAHNVPMAAPHALLVQFVLHALLHIIWMLQTCALLYQITVPLSIAIMYAQPAKLNILLIQVINVWLVQMDVNHVLGALLPAKWHVQHVMICNYNY